MEYAEKDMVKKELEEGLFYVLYQPKMLYPSGKICGAEALVRYSGNDDLADVIDRLEKSRTVKYVDFTCLRMCAEIWQNGMKRECHTSRYPVTFPECRL